MNDPRTGESRATDVSRFPRKGAWVVPVLAACAVYFWGLGNYFSFDDFIWLNRGRTFTGNWLQMFRPDVTYFDPVVHLMFFIDFRLAGITPWWYHTVDLALHAANAVLVYRFARLLNGDDRSALYAGILFAASYAVADAVLWTSSRVDLAATFFSLGTMIQFLHYLRTDRKKNLLFSFLLFLLALGSKGTPIVLPGILFWLIILEKKPLARGGWLAPFVLADACYLILVKLSMAHASLPLDRVHFNVRNFLLALCSIYIPEATLKYMDLWTTSLLLLAAISAFAVAGRSAAPLRRTGYWMILVSIVPVLAVTDFKLVTEYSDPSLLLASPSHRIYLASVGAALLGGGVLRAGELLLQKFSARLSTVVVTIGLVALVVGTSLLVRGRDEIWQTIGERSRSAVEGLLPYRGEIRNGDQVGLVYFPGSEGFMTPMVKVALNLDDLTIMRNIRIGMINDMSILGRAERTFLLMLENDGRVVSQTDRFRQMLLYNRMALLYPNRPEYRERCIAVASELDRALR